MKRQGFVVIMCGLLPLVVVHYAYWLNIHAPDSLAAAYQCNPYFEGCVSVSRAVRSGPGLFWFKAVMLPAALLLALSWRFISLWFTLLQTPLLKTSQWALRLGIGGAIALMFYVVFLGSEGDIYRWLRRYGVVFFFGFTALAQLFTAAVVWNAFHSVTKGLAAFFVVLAGLQWLVGVTSVFKRLVFDDPFLIDRLENVAEWLMLVFMSLGLVLIGLLIAGHKQHRPSAY